jgi:hypothetical protein
MSNDTANGGRINDLNEMCTEKQVDYREIIQN